MADAPFFPGFEAMDVAVDDVTIHAVRGGKGPPLLLLHGAPQSHVMWRHVAPGLAERFTVVAADLRGYGRSSKPEAGDYSKRRMAGDQVGLMRALGHERFRLAGHDRGARVARRLAKDHPQAVEKLAIIDIVPTAHIYSNTDRRVATNLWHWFFFIQPAPIPEMLMGPQAAAMAMGRAVGEDGAAAGRAYAETNGNAEAFHAMCEDYRAGAGIDIAHDEADAGTLIACPTLVIWGAQSGTTGQLFDVPSLWRKEAADVRFESIECGHFVPEEKPRETLDALLAFM
ncbi:MAG: alpha/beta hydrolase [Hyphomonadaceae bacterium]|nr:alpha/beta hydrolase [Hyphomonadaceae bacterium]